MSSATPNEHDWHCEEHDTYGWRGEACRKCPETPSEITALREQLAALAEQNEKLRTALCKLGDHDPDCSVVDLDDEGRHKDCTCGLTEALSLPDLATPVLNRIHAEGVRKASTLVSLVRNDWASVGDNLSVQAAEYLISALDARAAELEKS